jgi:hypothetical protein
LSALIQSSAICFLEPGFPPTERHARAQSLTTIQHHG